VLESGEGRHGFVVVRWTGCGPVRGRPVDEGETVLEETADGVHAGAGPEGITGPSEGGE
jgi:hypothetical protein